MIHTVYTRFGNEHTICSHPRNAPDLTHIYAPKCIYLSLLPKSKFIHRSLSQPPWSKPIWRTLQVRLARMAMYYYVHPISRHILVSDE